MGLESLRRSVWTKPPGSQVKCLDFKVRINDGPNFYIMYKDIFVHRIYDFTASRPDPFILDCGSNIGMSILYFKRRYPRSRIIGFEADPEVFPYLEGNVAGNGLRDVQLIPALLAGREGTSNFLSDGRCGSHALAEDFDVASTGFTKHQVQCHLLRDYLTEPVDFLKMNIEGSEWDVLEGSEDRLRQVREMVIEYHHLPGLPRTLHLILDLLHRQHFEYLINDFDMESNPGACPPFHLRPDSRYYLLVYARRID